MYLQTRLRILLLVALLPIAGIGVLGTGLLVEREIAALQQRTWERTRALTTTLDAQLQASVAALRLLATSPALAAGDMEGFRPEARRALQASGGHWQHLLVSDGHSGERQLSVAAPGVALLPAPAQVASILDAARSGQPTVSRLIRADDRRQAVAVRLPVTRSGQVAPLVLSAVTDVEALRQLVQQQGFPAQWTVAVIDEGFDFVVRQPAMPDGSTLSDSLRRALLAPTQGWTRGRLRDGSEVYRTVHRSAQSGWFIAISIPQAEIEQSLHHMRLLWLGFGLVLTASLALAWWLSRGVARPIAALAEAAPALGRGEPLVLPNAGGIEEVRQLCAALEQASVRLQERDAGHAAAEAALRAASRAKDEFLAMLGHELRNPLSSLSNAAALLQQAPERPELVARVAGVLGRQVPQMTRLVDDLLEVGRVTAGKITLVLQPLELAGRVRETLAAFEANGRFAGHVVAQDLQPVWVQADAARLEQIIVNLMDNALKYTPPGRRIAVNVRPDGAQALLQVADDGQGMSPELLRSAFDLFVQGERGPSRESGGLGLGLTLARRLVQLHGGDITAASAGVGQGSTFSVRLPAAAAPAVSAAGAPSTGTNGARSVLVVEDNVDAGESLVALLELLGHRAEWTDLGERGVQRAAALLPDLVLVDVGLPDIDGYEVARRLRAQPATQALRLVALTGYGTPEDRQRALAAGFDDHLAKPIGLPELEALLACS